MQSSKRERVILPAKCFEKRWQGSCRNICHQQAHGCDSGKGHNTPPPSQASAAAATVACGRCGAVAQP
eukprot:3270213-Amphidinium_carterae.1